MSRSQRVIQKSSAHPTPERRRTQHHRRQAQAGIHIQQKCYDSIDRANHRNLTRETNRQVRGRMLGHCSTVMTPLTEQKSLNLHDETTVCGQVQHTLFRAEVGKLQYTTGVRPDLMFVTKCLSYKLASPTLADLTRAKKALRYLKGTRELNLYLTIPAAKTIDLNRTLKHVTGYSDADWAGDPVTRKSTSCTALR